MWSWTSSTCNCIESNASLYVKVFNFFAINWTDLRFWNMCQRYVIFDTFNWDFLKIIMCKNKILCHIPKNILTSARLWQRRGMVWGRLTNAHRQQVNARVSWLEFLSHGLSLKENALYLLEMGQRSRNLFRSSHKYVWAAFVEGSVRFESIVA